jgi:hypothetical protein
MYDIKHNTYQGMFPAHFDAIAACSINKQSMLLATGSGQRHFTEEQEIDTITSDEDENENSV